MKTSFEDLFDEFLNWSIPIFDKATPASSLKKCIKEIDEIKKAFTDEPINEADIAEEYADAILCLIDSAKRAGFDIETIRASISRKIKINKARNWKHNSDHTYSHI